MKITAEIIYYKLSLIYQLQILHESDVQVAIDLPLLYEGTFSTKNALYLLNTPLPPDCKIPDSCAILFVCQADFDATNEALTNYCSDTMFPENIPCALVQDTPELLQVLYCVFEQIIALQSWDASLEQAHFSDTSLNPVLTLAQQEFRRELTVFDAQYVRVGWTSGFEQMFPVRPETEDIAPEQLNQLLASPEFIDADTRRGVQLFPLVAQEGRVLYWNIYREGEYVARFMAAIGADYVSAGERQLFVLLAGHIEQCYLRQFDNRLRERLGDSQHTLIRELLNPVPPVTLPRIAAMLSEVGWLPEHRYSLVVIRSYNRHHFSVTAPYLASRLEEIGPHSFALMSESELVWIINLSLDKQFAGKHLIAAIEEYTGNLIVHAGLSDVASGYAELHLLYREAEIALAVGQTKHPHIWYYRFTDYVTNYLIDRTTEELPAESICHQGFKRLRKYDHENSTNLVNCLASYLRCGLNVSRAAEECFVHRTTFIRYLRIIREITGIDLSGDLDLTELNHLVTSLLLFEY